MVVGKNRIIWEFFPKGDGGDIMGYSGRIIKNLKMLNKLRNGAQKCGMTTRKLESIKHATKLVVYEEEEEENCGEEAAQQTASRKEISVEANVVRPAFDMLRTLQPSCLKVIVLYNQLNLNTRYLQNSLISKERALPHVSIGCLVSLWRRLLIADTSTKQNLEDLKWDL